MAIVRFLSVALLLACFGKPAIAESCGNVSMAKMNWATADVTTAIDQYILVHGYGCNVELSLVEALPALVSMRDTGKPDLITELWANAVAPQIEQATSAGAIKLAAEVFTDGGEQGWWIPTYLAQAHPEIKSIDDALANPELFPSATNESKAAVHNCPESWACNIANKKLFIAFKAEEKGFELVESTSAAGLNASIAMAHEKQEGWLGYYWSPTSMLGRYKMTKLDAGPHDAQEWEACTTVPQCVYPLPNAWPRNNVVSVLSQEFANRETTVADYVDKRQWQNSTVNELLAWRAENQATGEEVAKHFLEQYEDVWKSWVPANIKTNIQAALVEVVEKAE